MRGQINEMQKGAVFLAELKRRLFMEGFTLAIPEPDIGDDLWVVDLDAGQREPRLLRCLLKSALASKDDAEKYTINLTKNEQSHLRQHFYVFIGLYDSHLNGSGFHIACFPGTFFQELINQDRLRLMNDGRRVFDFFLSRRDDQLVCGMRLKPSKRYAREEYLPVGSFFAKASMRAAIEACDLLASPGVVALPTPAPPAAG